MAGAGYKLFNTGDVLTAQQVNEYLQQQTVMVFADSTARTTALSGVLAEGMMSYLQDTNAVEVYNGSAWVGVSSDQIPLTTKGDLLTYSTTDTRLGVGTDGTVLTADSTQSTGLAWKTPSTAITWTPYALPANTTATSYSYPTFIKKINGYWIILTNNGFAFYSSDGKSWTRWTTGLEGVASLKGAIFANSTWVFYGGNGNLRTATTIGGSMTSRTSGFGANSILDGCYMAGSVNLFIIVGDSGLLTTSADAITWTARTANQGTDRIASIATNGTNMTVLISSGAYANNASYSSNGTSWTAVSPDNGSATSWQYPAVVYNSVNARWISLYGSNSRMTTTPTSTWTINNDTKFGTYSSAPDWARENNFGEPLQYDATNNEYINGYFVGNNQFVIFHFDAANFDYLTSANTEGRFRMKKIIQGAIAANNVQSASSSISTAYINFAYDGATDQYIVMNNTYQILTNK